MKKSLGSPVLPFSRSPVLPFSRSPVLAVWLLAAVLFLSLSLRCQAQTVVLSVAEPPVPQVTLLTLGELDWIIQHHLPICWDKVTILLLHPGGFSSGPRSRCFRSEN